MKKKSLFVALMACAMLGSSFLASCNRTMTSEKTSQTSGTKKVTEGDVCTGITIKTMPKTDYVEGEYFNPSAMVFDATYANGYDGEDAKNLTGGDLDSWTPAGKLKVTDKKATISFDGYKMDIDINVTTRTATEIAILSPVRATSYSIGDVVSFSGLVVGAKYSASDKDYTHLDPSQYTITDKDGKVYEDGVTKIETTDSSLELFINAGGKQTSFTVSVFAGKSIQIEDYVASGEELPTDKSYTTFNSVSDKINNKTVSNPKVILDNNATWTGKGYAGNITVGASIEFAIYSEKAMENVSLVLVAASTNNWNNATEGFKGMRDMQFNQCFSTSFGTDKDKLDPIYLSNNTIVPGKEVNPNDKNQSYWTNWANVDLGMFNLQQGFNYLKLDCIGGYKDGTNYYPRVPNIDRLDIKYYDENNITQGDVCTNMDITSMPTKLTYTAGEKFDPAGLKFNAAFKNGYAGEDTKNLTENDLNTFTPNRPLETTDKTVTLIYKGFEKTIDIIVNPAVDTGKVEMQIEDITKTEPYPTNRSYLLASDPKYYSIKSDATWTGTGYAGDIKKGAWFTLAVYSDKEVTGAEVILSAASTFVAPSVDIKRKDMPVNKNFKLSYGTDINKLTDVTRNINLGV